MNGNDCLTSFNHIHTACAYCCTPDTKPALYFSQTLWSTNKLTAVCVYVCRLSCIGMYLWVPKHFITPKQKEKELRPKTQKVVRTHAVPMDWYQFKCVICCLNGMPNISNGRICIAAGLTACLPSLLACLPAATKYTCFSCKHILWHSNWNAVKSKRPLVLFDTCIKLILSQVTCGEQCSKLKKM